MLLWNNQVDSWIAMESAMSTCTLQSIQMKWKIILQRQAWQYLHIAGVVLAMTPKVSVQIGLCGTLSLNNCRQFYLSVAQLGKSIILWQAVYADGAAVKTGGGGNMIICVTPTHHGHTEITMRSFSGRSTVESHTNWHWSVTEEIKKDTSPCILLSL